MTNDFAGEQWKTVQFDFEFTNEIQIQVSNFGRLRTFNKISDGNVLKGAMVSGYGVLRLRLFKPRDKAEQGKFDYLDQQISKLTKKLRTQIANAEEQDLIQRTTLLLNALKDSTRKKLQEDLKARTVNYQCLVHRLVATYFLRKPTSQQTVVAHLDHDKLNNRASNLKWMTPTENYAHQKHSPLVIQEMKDRRNNNTSTFRTTKLTVTKVMLLKKLLNEGKPMKQLIKQFKITNTQIYRIKRGENWADIEAAK